MARIRTIKPEMPGHHKIAKVSLEARLFLVWLITDADDEGRIAASPKRLAGTLYPHDDDVTSVEITKWTDELVAFGLATRYFVDGVPFIELPGWDHQKISKPSPSRYPSSEEAFSQVTEPPEVPQGNPGEPTDTQVARARADHDLGPRILDLGPSTNTVELVEEIHTGPVPIVEDKPRPLASVSPITPKGPTRAQVVEVWDYWREIMNSPNSDLTTDRENKIRWALKHFSAEDCKQAILGCSMTPHNMGVNDRGTKFNGVKVIFKDADQVERFKSVPAKPSATPGGPVISDSLLERMAAAQAGNVVR